MVNADHRCHPFVDWCGNLAPVACSPFYLHAFLTVAKRGLRMPQMDRGVSGKSYDALNLVTKRMEGESEMGFRGLSEELSTMNISLRI